MSELTNSPHRHRERMTEEMGLQMFSLKTDIDDADETLSGRVFHSRAAVTRISDTEKLDRRWLKDGYVGQQAMMSKQSGEADEPRQQMTTHCSGIPQQGMELSDTPWMGEARGEIYPVPGSAVAADKHRSTSSTDSFCFSSPFGRGTGGNSGRAYLWAGP